MNTDSLVGPTAASLTPNQTQIKPQTDEVELRIIRDLKVVKKKKNDAAVVGVDMEQISKHLSAFAQKVLSKLEEVLGDKLPEGGIAALKPEDHTPEKTAQRIVDGATGLFFAFAKQNPELEGEELLDKFMSTIRGGIKQGYEDAAGILEAVGAFKFDGVKEGIEKTMQLVDEKLKAFEEMFRKQILNKDNGESESDANESGGIKEANA